MTGAHDNVVSPAIVQLLQRLCAVCATGHDAALVGPSGGGVSTVGDLLAAALTEAGLTVAALDCMGPGSWQDAFRLLCETVAEKQDAYGQSPVLLVDHAADLSPAEIQELQTAIRAWNVSLGDGEAENDVVRFSSCVWLGNLDCRALEVETGLHLASEPRGVMHLPEHHGNDLLGIYAAIGKRQESDWGEAILSTIHDWCGTDLALAVTLGAHFYGDWRDRPIYDDTVQESIERWVNTDPLVEEYRQRISRLADPAKQLVQLLNGGGKIASHAPFCDQEPDAGTRQLFLDGILSANLLPGFYQTRNLTMRLLALQSDTDAPEVSAQDLLRKSTNGRIAEVLQDAELSLRMLILKCFGRMGYDAVRDKLKATRTDDQAVPTPLRQSLQEWAKTNGDAELQKSLGKHLTEYRKEREAASNLWTRVCGLHAEETGEEVGAGPEPPLANIVAYMTFGELSNLLLSLDSSVFVRWEAGAEQGKDSPAKRWPEYMARLRRLRNQSAHLRNVALQDIEDLLVTVRQMRRDIQDYA